MAEGEETPDTRAVDPAGADAAASGEARPQDTPPDPSPYATFSPPMYFRHWKRPSP